MACLNGRCAGGRIRIALVNDYDVVVVVGLARILERYTERLGIVEIDTNEAVADEADVVLNDTFAQPESDRFEISELVGKPQVGKVAVYTWKSARRADRTGTCPGRVGPSVQSTSSS